MSASNPVKVNVAQPCVSACMVSQCQPGDFVRGLRAADSAPVYQILKESRENGYTLALRWESGCAIETQPLSNLMEVRRLRPTGIDLEEM